MTNKVITKVRVGDFWNRPEAGVVLVQGPRRTDWRRVGVYGSILAFMSAFWSLVGFAIKAVL